MSVAHLSLVQKHLARNKLAASPFRRLMNSKLSAADPKFAFHSRETAALRGRRASPYKNSPE